MMTDKSQQIVGQLCGSPVSRQWIEDGYPVKFTDRQWEIFVDYLSEVDDKEQFDEDITYAIYNIETLEAEYDEYDKVFKGIHGKTSKELEEGKD
jgi:hypothetical protein